MSDATNARIKAATRQASERTGITKSPPTDKPFESIIEAVVAAAVVPTYTDPHIEVPALASGARPWPVTAGPSDPYKVAPSLRKAINEAVAASRWPIYLFGPAGVGKTCAAACVWRSWPRWPLWYETSEIINRIVRCRTSDDSDDSERGLTNKIRDTPLIVLNDFGIRAPTEAAFEILIRIIDLRLGKPLIVTSNLEPEQLAKVFDDRVASRLLRGSVVHCVGDDRRSAGAKFVRVKAGNP